MGRLVGNRHSGDTLYLAVDSGFQSRRPNDPGLGSQQPTSLSAAVDAVVRSAATDLDLSHRLEFRFLHDLGRQSVSLQDYVNRAYVPRAEDSHEQLLALIATRQFTSLAVLNVLVRILQFNPSFAQRTQVRYARCAEIRDLKTRNVILVGSPRGNPWVATFEPHLNFLQRYDPKTGRAFFQNVSPKSGEPLASPANSLQLKRRAWISQALLIFEILGTLAGRSSSAV